ncbi:MAG: CAP domain-containing protein [Chitinophagales bacterium]
MKFYEAIMRLFNMNKAFFYTFITFSLFVSSKSLLCQNTYTQNDVINIYNIDIELLEKCMLEETNRIRHANGLSYLHEDALLQKAALLHSSQMNKYAFFNHVNPKIKEIATVDKRLQYYNYPYQSYAENILYTYIDKNNPPTYKQLAGYAIKLLYKSKEHRKNIVNRIYTDIGVGIVLAKKYDANYVYFYLTQDFGTK